MDVLLTNVIGVAVLGIVGHVAVPGILNSAAKTPATPSIVGEKVWERLTKGADGGSWVGFLERTLFFVAFAFSHESLAAAWLAFKLASKWEIWKNVIRIPDAPDAEKALDWLVWTHDYGSWILQRFWIGVLSNVLLAFVAAMGARYAYHALR